MEFRNLRNVAYYLYRNETIIIDAHRWKLEGKYNAEVLINCTTFMGLMRCKYSNKLLMSVIKWQIKRLPQA